MAKIYLVSDWGHIKEVSHEHWDIKNEKNNNLIHRWYTKKGDEIIFLDKERELAKPTVRSLYKDQFKREKKQSMVIMVLFIALILSLILWILKKPQVVNPIQTQQPQIISLTDEKPVEEITKNEDFIISQNKELTQKYSDLEIEYNNLDQTYQMAQESIESLLNKEKKILENLEIEKKQFKLELEKEQKNDKYEIYKEVENTYYSQKREEFKKVWEVEEFEKIKKFCKAAYNSKKLEDDKKTVNNW